jgi:hypothetical protein
MTEKEKEENKQIDITTTKTTLKDNCTQWNIIQLYKYLKDEAPKHWWVVGVAKGDGYPPQDIMKEPEIFKDASSVYKLAYMNYKELEKNDIRYNPYHTTFLEDVIFNSHPSLKEKRHIGICTKIQLRFAHPWKDNVKSSEIDYNDCINSDTDFYKGPSVFKPVFFIKYLEELKNKGYKLEGDEKKKYIGIGKDLISTGSGKYSYLHFVVILLYMMIHTPNDRLLYVAGETPNFFKGFLDYKILILKDCQLLSDGKEYPFEFTDNWKNKLQNLLKLEKDYIEKGTISETDSNEYTNTLNELKNLNSKIQTQINTGDLYIRYQSLASALPDCYYLNKKRKR